MTDPQITIARKVHFSSGLKYALEHLSEQENRELFGDLYSPHGYGHNFTLEAYVKGPVDQKSGLIMNISDLDKMMKEAVEPLDHHFINTDVPEFKNQVPSTENLAKYCFEKLRPQFQNPEITLEKVRLFESEFQWVDYGDQL